MRSLVVLAVLLASTAAFARNGGLYFELAPSWGFYSTEEVIIEEGNDTFSDFPVATAQFERLVSIPLFSTMTKAEVDHVVDAIRRLTRRFRR